MTQTRGSVSNPAWIITARSPIGASTWSSSQELTSRHAKDTMGLRCMLPVYVGLAPRCLVYPSLLWSWHKPSETEMTKHCRSAFSLKAVFQSSVGIFSRRSFPLFCSQCFHDVCDFFFFFLWFLCDVIILVFTEIKTGTHLIVEPFPSPETQTHPICLFCFFQSHICICEVFAGLTKWELFCSADTM